MYTEGRGSGNEHLVRVPVGNAGALYLGLGVSCLQDDLVRDERRGFAGYGGGVHHALVGGGRVGG